MCEFLNTNQKEGNKKPHLNVFSWGLINLSFPLVVLKERYCKQTCLQMKYKHEQNTLLNLSLNINTVFCHCSILFLVIQTLTLTPKYIICTVSHRALSSYCQRFISIELICIPNSNTSSLDSVLIWLKFDIQL